MRTDLSTASFKGTAFFTSCLILNFNKQRENVAGATDMFRFRFVVHIFTRTQYLHFLASKKTKARKIKGEINAELEQTRFFFLSGTGRLCDEANQERNTADSRLDFISKCTSTWTDAFIPLCFFCQWELNYGGVLKCFVIAIWERYIYVLPLTKNIFIFFLCHWSFFVHTHPYFDGQLKSHLNSHQPLVWQLCPPLQWARIIEANRYRGQAVADLGVHVMLMKTTVQSLQKDIHLRNNLWTCYRIGNDHFFYCCIYIFGRCIDAFYQSWRSKPWPWDHYASWASWIVKW